MDTLFFLTDRFPYGKGEAFIENEIPYLAQRFKTVYIIPTALTTDIKVARELPENFVVLKPANTDDLYSEGRPSKAKRIIWSLKHMVPWCVASFFSKDLYIEVGGLIKHKHFTVSRFFSVVRSLAPNIRNKKYFRSYFRNVDMRCDGKVYVYSYWMNASVLHIGKILGNIPVCKIVARAHGYDLYEERRANNYIPFQRSILNKIDDLCLISENGRAYIKNKYPEFSRKLSIGLLGTKDYGIGPFNYNMIFRIVSCSAVIPVKRVDRIIDALSRITDAQIEWVHFGAGQDYEKTKSYARDKLESLKNIKYDFKGQILNQELMKYYKENYVNLFVNVSESEGLPVSIMEAISFGIPVVATDVGGTSEAFEDKGDNSLLRVDFSDEELTQQILRYFQMNEKDMIEKRKQVRKLWENKFSADKNYKEFVSRYLS